MEPHQIYTIENDPVFSLVAEEDNYVATCPNFERRRPGLYPSSASVEYMDGDQKVVVGKCLRQSYYEALQTQPDGPKSVSLNMKGSLGIWDESGMIDKWKKMGLWVGNNISFYDKELAVSGKLDAILRNPMTNKPFGLELKTFYGYAAGRTLCGIKREKGTGRKFPGRPKNEHFLQSSVYAWEYRDVLDEYRLYYLERGDGHRLEFRVGTEQRDDGEHVCWWEQIPGKYWNYYEEGKVYQPYTIENIHERYKRLLKLLRARKLPPREFQEVWDEQTVEYKFSVGEVSKTNYDKWKKNPTLKSNQLGSWQCSYCPYTKLCSRDDTE